MPVPDAVLFEENDTNTLKQLTLVSSGLSLVGGVVVLISAALVPHLRQFPGRLVLCLTIGDTLAAASYLISDSSQDDGAFSCLFSASLMSFSQSLSVLYTACIAHSVLRMAAADSNDDRSLEPLYHFVCTTLPLISIIVLASTRQFGPTAVWCWIPVNHTLARMVSFYGPLFLAFLYILVTYGRVLKLINTTLRQLLTEAPTAESRSHYERSKFEITRQISVYVGVFILCWLPAVINRVQNWIAPASPVYALFALQASMSPAQAFVNALAYAMNSRLRAEWRAILLGAWKRLRRFGSTYDRLDTI